MEQYKYGPLTYNTSDSDDETGNFYKEFYMQDAPENPTAAIGVSLNQVDSYNQFNIGREVYIRLQNLYIGETTAEKVKITIGAATEDLENPPEDMLVQGRDLLSGKPKQVQVSYREIAKALDKSILRIEDAVMETLSKTPPELAADIYNTGIYLAGGGSMLRGLDKRLSRKTDLPVYISEDPLKAVVRGTGIALKELEKYKSVLMK